MAIYAKPYFDPAFFVSSGELAEDVVLDELTQNPPTPADDGFFYYLGVSGLQNENYLSAMAVLTDKIRAVFLDINGTTCQLHQIVKNRLLTSTSRQEFCRAMHEVRLPFVGDRYFEPPSPKGEGFLVHSSEQPRQLPRL
jgi:hypothetical protein